MPINTGISGDISFITIWDLFQYYTITDVIESIWGHIRRRMIITNLPSESSFNLVIEWTWLRTDDIPGIHQCHPIPPTFVIRSPRLGNIPPLFITNSSIQKNSGKNFMRIIRPPHYSRMKSAILIIIYRGGIIIAYRIRFMLEAC